MSFVPGFEYDIFLSYASGDNDQGAVEEFVGTLGKHISDNLVNYFSPQEKIRIYFDRERLAKQTAVNWEENLKAAASSSALLVPLLSPNYLDSPYCSKELNWFAVQPHVLESCPFGVVGWRSVEQKMPKELAKAERHPASASWLALLSPDERMKSAAEFALKMRNALVKMRASVSAVFLGPAAGLGLATRRRLRDELEKSGYRVTPDADYQYKDEDEVREHLNAALLAIHFPGDGLSLEGIEAMEEPFLPDRKTLLVRPFGSILSSDETDLLTDIDKKLVGEGRFPGAAYMRLEGKTDDQVWDIVKREVRAARFKKYRSDFTVGVACEVRDLVGAKAVASLIAQQGIRAHYPLFDTAVSIAERLRALRTTIIQSQSLLCYLAKAEGKGLEGRLEQDALRRYLVKALYLVPPFDVPGKEKLSQSFKMVLQQTAADADLITLEPFLRELGWEPPI
jgi:hypothetical protein